jgi:hypothetical protein
MKSYLVTGDWHVPFHDVDFINIIFTVIRKHKPEGIILGGDLLDFYKISSFKKDPSRGMTIRDELEQLRDLLRELRDIAGGDTDIRYIKGNHSARLETYIWTKAPEVHNLIKSIPEVLELDKLRIKWVDERAWNSCKIEDVNIIHGTYINKHVAAANLEKYREKIVQFHVHRTQLIVNDSIWSATIGTGSNISETNFITESRPNASQSFGFINFVDGKGYPEIYTVEDKKAIVRGELIESAPKKFVCKTCNKEKERECYSTVISHGKKYRQTQCKECLRRKAHIRQALTGR